ncbi:MAG: hypothetical protein GXO32_02570 [Crenarchaeota archaeon]|nr:hypothetical protein [Thermoproteota archaeon]
MSADKILGDLMESVRKVEEELNISGAIVIAEGRPSCSDCLRIEVDSVKDFTRVLAAMVRQGIAVGSLPILVLIRRTSNSVAIYGVNMCDQVIVSLELELKY